MNIVAEIKKRDEYWEKRIEEQRYKCSCGRPHIPNYGKVCLCGADENNKTIDRIIHGVEKFPED